MKAREKLNIVDYLNLDGIVLFDTNQMIKHANQSFLTMTGLTLQECSEMNLQDIVDWLIKCSCDSHRFPSLEDLTQPGNVLDSPSNYKKAICHLKSPKTAVVIPRLMLFDDGVPAHLLYLRNITHESSLEKIKTWLIGTAAHERRTPLTTVLGYTDMLLAKNIEPDLLRHCLSLIQSNSMRMSSFLDDFLDLQKIENAAPPLDGRSGRLSGIRINDTGYGMTPDEQDRIFEIFCRADEHGTVPGNGLGIPLVEEIMERHGGEITVNSQKHVGTSVCLHFPTALVTAGANGPSTPELSE